MHQHENCLTCLEKMKACESEIMVVVK